MRRPPALAARLALTSGVALVALGAGCGSPAPFGGATTADGIRPVAVVATTTQVQDFVRVVGGDCVDRYGVLKPNVDPHDYEPSPADLDAVARAEVIVENGVGLEAWLDDTIASADSHAAVVDSSAGVEVHHGGGEDPGGDPHIWQDPRNAKVMVANIAAALTAARPACAATFAANQAAYDAQLDALDVADQAVIDTLTNKKLVTNHDAFGYYVDRYGLEFVGSVVPSFDSSAELSAAQIDRLVGEIRRQGVKAVFSETSLPPKTAAAIAAEAGVTVVEGGDALYGDTLGPPGSPGATYLEMMAHNTETIVDHLR